MSEIERLIRPFIQGTSTPPRVLPTSKQGDADNMVLEISARGSVKVYQTSYKLATTSFMTKQEKETKTP